MRGLEGCQRRRREVGPKVASSVCVRTRSNVYLRCGCLLRLPQAGKSIRCIWVVCRPKGSVSHGRGAVSQRDALSSVLLREQHAVRVVLSLGLGSTCSDTSRAATYCRRLWGCVRPHIVTDRGTRTLTALSPFLSWCRRWKLCAGVSGRGGMRIFVRGFLNINQKNWYNRLQGHLPYLAPGISVSATRGRLLIDTPPHCVTPRKATNYVKSGL